MYDNVFPEADLEGGVRGSAPPPPPRPPTPLKFAKHM